MTQDLPISVPQRWPLAVHSHTQLFHMDGGDLNSGLAACCKHFYLLSPLPSSSHYYTILIIVVVHRCPSWLELLVSSLPWKLA